MPLSEMTLLMWLQRLLSIEWLSTGQYKQMDTSTEIDYVSKDVFPFNFTPLRLLLAVGCQSLVPAVHLLRRELSGRFQVLRFAHETTRHFITHFRAHCTARPRSWSLLPLC